MESWTKCLAVKATHGVAPTDAQWNYLAWFDGKGYSRKNQRSEPGREMTSTPRPFEHRAYKSVRTMYRFFPT